MYTVYLQVIHLRCLGFFLFSGHFPCLELWFTLSILIWLWPLIYQNLTMEITGLEHKSPFQVS